MMQTIKNVAEFILGLTKGLKKMTAVHECLTESRCLISVGA